MLKQRQEQIGVVVRVIDILICIAAFLAAYEIRTWPSIYRPNIIGPLESVFWMLGASLVIHTFLYHALGFYASLRRRSVSELVAMVMKGFFFEFFILGSMVFMFQAKATSRYFFALFLVLNYSFILIEKVGARIILARVRRRGYNVRQVLIYGTGKTAQYVIQAFRNHPHWGYLAVGILREPAAPEEVKSLSGVPVIGGLSALESVVLKRPVDEVYFASDVFIPNEVSDSVLLCEKLGVSARISLGMFDLLNSKVDYTPIENLPVITYYTTLRTPLQAVLKRFMDIGIAVVGLVITGILYPWIAWRIKRESPGPVIYKQPRVGENGRTFRCYKFRTMVDKAHERKGELTGENQMEGPLFKVKNDPRVTSFGVFLRRTSLDELPQFFNILRGDMSVVGTRPPTPDEVEKYETHYRRRLSIRPGLTGLWQVSGRNQVSRFEDVLKLDLHYIDHWSLWLDIRIIMRTIWVALFQKGAY